MVDDESSKSTPESGAQVAKESEGATDIDITDENSIENGEKAKHLLKVLEFKNPGPQLQGFNPDTSRREQRKLRRLVQTTNKTKSKVNEDKPKRKPKRALHDSSGCRIIDGKDMCDCQDVNCPGCHFPCPACGSEKCGVECRIDRRWTYDKHIEFNNPFSAASGRDRKAQR